MLRRDLLKTLSLTAIAGTAPAHSLAPNILKPNRLKAGDTIGIVGPAAPAYNREQVQVTVESLQAMGLKVSIGKHIYDRYGYLAGRDTDRAADLNAAFADPNIKAIIAMHGGWGCARLLPLLDYATIAKNPKPLLGYSDITALLLGIYAKTGLVTFHGPEGAATWNQFTVGYLQKVLFEAEAVLMQNPKEKADLLVQEKDRTTTLVSGKARGRLIGGNLTVLSHIVGSPYLPDFKNAILFLEDVDEAPYRMDRMLTQLKLAGILDQIAGFVFGKCTECEAKGGYGSLTLWDVFDDHIVPLGKPAYTGAMIGHIKDKFTVPLGIEAELNADAGTLQLLEAAVL